MLHTVGLLIEWKFSHWVNESSDHIHYLWCFVESVSIIKPLQTALTGIFYISFVHVWRSRRNSFSWHEYGISLVFLEGRNVLVRECYKSRSSEYQEPICCIARIVLLYEICLFLTNYINLQKKKNTNKANWQQQRQFGANFWLETKVLCGNFSKLGTQTNIAFMKRPWFVRCAMYYTTQNYTNPFLLVFFSALI